ncbi:hypothetical protein [Pararhizobium haloflavum]|uniref:hypothetical protein n=1 Tax=Pararhizobium haloflavum TaxID=2037914 RepID=UPI000C185A56|nr:hypothetical protein [Pararhizobium haloflavum]
MKKTAIALTTGLLLAAGSSAFAQTSALDLPLQPERTINQEIVPNVGLSGGDSYVNDEYSASNNFGDEAPAIEQNGTGIDYTPTAAIDDGNVYDEYSPQNGFGDHGPHY